MDEQEFLKQLAPIMADETPIQTTITIRDFWFMDSVLSLAWRHPELSLHQKNWIMHLHLQIITPILDRYPEAKPLIESGWNTEMDVKIDRNQTERINQEMIRLQKRYNRKTGRK